MTAQVDLRRCFVQPFTIPIGNYHTEPLFNTNPNSSSTTTATVSPPKFAQKVPKSYWIDNCTGFMGLMPANVQQILQNENLCHDEPVTRHASEGDVVRSAAMYVLHPVNQALAVHPNTTGSVTCLAETTANKLRADITYFRNAAPSKRAFAVVEFKKRQLIDPSQFEKAEKVNSARTQAQVIQQAPDLVARAADNNDDRTFYDLYSCKLMKQAAAYATQHRTKYVALFNWGVLVLVKFQAMELANTAGIMFTPEQLRRNGVGTSISCLRAVWGPRSMTFMDKNDNKRKTMTISGFCAIGKNHFLSNKDTLQYDVGIRVYDLDSSAYSSEPGFPHNYLSKIRKQAEKLSIILISTHRGVPTQLAKDGYYVALIYPGDGPDAKREWLHRLEDHGREQGEQGSRLYEFTNENWDLWYKRTADEEVTSRWTLSNDQYLSTIFENIHADFRKFQSH